MRNNLKNLNTLEWYDAENIAQLEKWGIPIIKANYRSEKYMLDLNKLLVPTPKFRTYSVDGNILTSRGVGTAIPFALAIVAYFQGQESAQALAEKIVFG